MIIRIVMVEMPVNSGTDPAATAITESAEVEGVTRETDPSLARIESSTVSKVNPAFPVAVTLKVTVAMFPLPLNARCA